MADSVDVRRLVPVDAAELARVLAVFAPTGELEANGRPAASVAHLSSALATPSCYVIVASAAGAPVGYVSAYRFPRLDHASDQVYVFDIEVAPAARRRGIGRRLVATLLETCWADGVTWAWAGTAKDNVAAQRLFGAAGGERGGETYIEYEFTPAE